MGVDFGYDGVYYDTQMDDMYWLIENDKFVIQGINELKDTSVLPLGFHVDSEGTNEIMID